jgi:hypothetical protein
MKKIDITKTLILLLLTALFSAGCKDGGIIKDESPFDGNDNSIVAFTLTKGGVTLKGAVSPGAVVITAPERFSLSGAAVTVALSENATIEPDPSTITEWDSAQTFTVTSYSGEENAYAYSVERRTVSRDGDVTLLTQADVDAFVAELDGAGQIRGSITVGAATGQDSVYSLTGMEQLKIVTGGIVINATYAGEVIAAFESLEVTDELRIASKTVQTVRFPKLVALRSNLHIDQASAVRTLGFPELTTIDKNFQLNYVDSLTEMNFSKLREVEGTFSISGRYNGTHKMQSVEFPALESVKGNFSITYWQGATAATFPALTRLDGTLSMNSVPALETFAAPKLETAAGITLNGDALASIDLSSLKQISGTGSLSLTSKALEEVRCPVLETVNGGIYFPATVRNLEFPALKTVGSLTVPDAPNPPAMRFPLLKTIKNELYIQSKSLVSLETFSAVDSIGGRLYLYNASALTSIEGLSSLKSAGSINAVGLTSLTAMDVRGITTKTLDLSGYPKGFALTGDDNFTGELLIGTPDPDVTDIASAMTVQGFKTVGSFRFSSYQYYTDATIPWLEKVTGQITFNSGGVLKNISLPNLKSAGGIDIQSYLYELETVSLPQLETITGYLNAAGATVGGFSFGVASSSEITSLVVPKLKSIVGNMSIIGLTATRKLETVAFPALKSITGTLTITGTNNAVFTDLSGFGALTAVSGVRITGFTQLKNFEPLKNLVSGLEADQWTVGNCGYNPTLQDMIDGKYSN